MPRTSARGGPVTRARIAEAAAQLFIEHGFDAVTVAQVARAAGVSSVTVFNHFPRKEDLYLDRSAEAAELLRDALRGDDADDPITALQSLTERLIGDRHPLSGLDDRSVPFFRTVAASPALVARAREIAADLQQVLTEQLRTRLAPDDATLLAAWFVAGYATVLQDTARRLMAGDGSAPVSADHRARFDRLFTALRAAFPGPGAEPS